ncbi:MAG: VCBS repeat-containing protein [Planctomycetes bacterium]|nr:VCBS repeat-containing protein [Planctomycetota bacterium]
MRKYHSPLAAGFILSLFLLGALLAGEKEKTGTAPVLRFSEQLIAGKYSYAYGVAAADLDGDGDIDLTSQDVVGGSAARGEPTLSSLFWFENDGRGNFRRHVIHQGEPGWFERHVISDINGDGRPDVAVVNNRDGHIVWFANNNRPAAGPWKRYVITTKCPRAYDVVLADLDGDGLPDAAAAGYASGLITWFRNPGKKGWDREWSRHVIDDRMPEARTIRAGDINGDGNVDLLAAAVGAENVPPGVTNVKQHGSQVVWYENPGKGASGPWKKHVIDNTTRAPIHGQLVDLDGDGDLDVVMAHGMRDELVPADRHEVVWYENVGKPGRGLQWKQHKIGALPYAFEAVAADLDGDGDLDVVATAWSKGDRVVWFENPGDPHGKWKMHLLKKDWKAANQVIIADLNGDKRPDIIATSDNGSRRIDYKGANELRWWKNEGKR